MLRSNWGAALSKLVLIACCAMLAAGIKGIPRRDLTQHLPQADVYAAEAYKEGVAIHDQATALELEAAGAKSAARERLLERARKRHADALARFDAALDFATRASEAPPFLSDLHARYGAAKLSLGDLPGARAAIEKSLAVEPGKLRALYALAGVQLAQRDYPAVRETYASLEREAEIYAEAWDYIDRLIADMRLVAATADADPGFAAWVDEQATIVAESVRWSTLEDP